MKTVKLNTGVVIELDDDGNQLSVISPYVKETPLKKTILRYYADVIKSIIKN